jgi:hypothetical protein
MVRVRAEALALPFFGDESTNAPKGATSNGFMVVPLGAATLFLLD